MVELVFNRELRLLTTRSFNFVFQQPTLARTSYITILGRINKLSHPRIGLTVAKKYVKQAHERNRIKRLTRESFRLHQKYLPAMDFVVIAKTGVDRLANDTIHQLLEQLWHCHCQLYLNY